MQIILMDDLERVGHEGDVIAVADGYARNYLIPRGLAVAATRGALKDLERRRAAIGGREDDKREKAQAIVVGLSEKRIVVKARAGTADRIHGQVTPQMIADAAKEQIRTEIDRRDIEIPEPIRELGDFLIGVRVYKDVHAQLAVSVIRDDAADEDQYIPLPKAAPAPVAEEPAEDAPEADTAEDAGEAQAE